MTDPELLTPPVRRCWTPPTLGKFLGIAPEKIIALIKRGEIDASNITLDTRGRARWIITPQAVEKFLRARQPTPPTPRLKRRRKASDTPDFFPDLS